MVKNTGPRSGHWTVSSGFNDSAIDDGYQNPFPAYSSHSGHSGQPQPAGDTKFVGETLLLKLGKATVAEKEKQKKIEADQIAEKQMQSQYTTFESPSADNMFSRGIRIRHKDGRMEIIKQPTAPHVEVEPAMEKTDAEKAKDEWEKRDLRATAAAQQMRIERLVWELNEERRARAQEQSASAKVSNASKPASSAKTVFSSADIWRQIAERDMKAKIEEAKRFSSSQGLWPQGASNVKAASRVDSKNNNGWPDISAHKNNGGWSTHSKQNKPATSEWKTTPAHQNNGGWSIHSKQNKPTTSEWKTTPAQQNEGGWETNSKQNKPAPSGWNTTPAQQGDNGWATAGDQNKPGSHAWLPADNDGSGPPPQQQNNQSGNDGTSWSDRDRKAHPVTEEHSFTDVQFKRAQQAIKDYNAHQYAQQPGNQDGWNNSPIQVNDLAQAVRQALNDGGWQNNGDGANEQGWNVRNAKANGYGRQQTPQPEGGYRHPNSIARPGVISPHPLSTPPSHVQYDDKTTFETPVKYRINAYDPEQVVNLKREIKKGTKRMVYLHGVKLGLNAQDYENIASVEREEQKVNMRLLALDREMKALQAQDQGFEAGAGHWAVGSQAGQAQPQHEPKRQMFGVEAKNAPPNAEVLPTNAFDRMEYVGSGGVRAGQNKQKPAMFGWDNNEISNPRCGLGDAAEGGLPQWALDDIANEEAPKSVGW